MPLTPKKNFDLVCSEKFLKKHEVIPIKLTDAALTAIETSASSLDLKKLRINFSGKEGTLTVPNQNGGKMFTFGVTTINQDPKGSYDCLSLDQRRTKLHTQGKMTHKMTIHAQDDVFAKTREKISHAEVEAKSNVTQVLKSATTAKGKQTVRRPLPAGKSLPTKPAPSAPVKPAPAPVSLESLRDRVIHLLAVNTYNKPEIQLRLQKDGLTDADKANLVAVLEDVGTERRGRIFLKAFLMDSVKDDWPFYSAEDKALLKQKRSAMAKSVVRTAPSKQTNQTSMEFSEKAPRSDRSAFAPHPIQTKIKVLDLLAEGLTPFAVSTRLKVTDALIAKWQKEEVSIRQTYQRKRTYEMCGQSTTAQYKEPSTKHSRVSGPAPVPNTTSPVSELSSTECSPSVAGSKAKAQQMTKEKEAKAHLNKVEMTATKTAAPDDVRVSGGKENQQSSTSSSAKHLPGMSFLMDTDNSGPLSNLNEEYLTKFGRITSLQDRIRYKRQFAIDYPEYRKLFEQMKKKELTIADYDKRLENVPTDREEYNRICSEVVSIYDDVQCHQSRRVAQQLAYLHKKLKHLKMRIKEFDAKRGVTKASS